MTAGRLFAAILFWSGSLIALGFALALGDEGFAVLTGRDPTISAITATAVKSSPRLSVALMCAACLLIGALVAHFTDWVP